MERDVLNEFAVHFLSLRLIGCDPVSSASRGIAGRESRRHHRILPRSVVAGRGARPCVLVLTQFPMPGNRV